MRGGIVDVFPPTEEHPLRVEFWGDEVERDAQLRRRRPAVASSPSSGCRRPPCRELLLTDEVRDRAAELARTHETTPPLPSSERLAEGIAVEGMESLPGAGRDEMELLVDLLPAGTHVLLADPERIRTRAHDLVATSEEFLGASWSTARRSAATRRSTSAPARTAASTRCSSTPRRPGTRSSR